MNLKIKLVVWLGNPGKEYEKTRHNIWFIIVDDFVSREKLGTRAYDNKRKWEMIEANIWDQKVMVLKPMEFMNRSWWAIGALANFYKIDPKDILVIHDDIDLHVGKIQLKLWWSSAGHNWLKNTIEKLWTKDPAKDGAGFWRLRIGVDRPLNQSDVADYVLSIFTKEEKNIIEDQISEIEKFIMEFLSK